MPMRRAALVALAACTLLASPALARDSLGVFEHWGAFRDPDIGRCYAITEPEAVNGARRFKPFASIGYWPKRKVRGQVHFRLSRPAAKGSPITLSLGTRTFDLTGGGGDAWARDAGMDAAIVAAMRSGERMRLRAKGATGGTIRDTYLLRGAATAMDAAAVGCAQAR